MPHRRATSSGSVSLNSHSSPVQLMHPWHDRSVRSSSRNCHSCMGPLPVGTNMVLDNLFHKVHLGQNYLLKQRLGSLVCHRRHWTQSDDAEKGWTHGSDLNDSFHLLNHSNGDDSGDVVNNGEEGSSGDVPAEDHAFHHSIVGQCRLHCCYCCEDSIRRTTDPATGLEALLSEDPKYMTGHKDGDGTGIRPSFHSNQGQHIDLFKGATLEKIISLLSFPGTWG